MLNNAACGAPWEAMPGAQLGHSSFSSLSGRHECSRPTRSRREGVEGISPGFPTQQWPFLIGTRRGPSPDSALPQNPNMRGARARAQMETLRPAPILFQLPAPIHTPKGSCFWTSCPQVQLLPMPGHQEPCLCYPSGLCAT